MKSILRLFPAWHLLEREMEIVRRSEIEAEARCRAREEEVRWLREQYQAKDAEAQRATRALANFGIQLHYGVRIFEDAPTVPASSQRGPVVVGPELKSARRARSEAEKSFFDETGAMFDRLMKEDDAASA